MKRQLHIREVDGAELVVVVRRLVPGSAGDPGFDCADCPTGEHWHVNTFWRDANSAVRAKVLELLADLAADG